MLGFNPISSLPISAIPALFVPSGPVGGAPNYQYRGEASIEPTRDGINALFDTAGRADAQRRRLQEARRALGLIPEPSVEPPPPPETIAEPFDEAVYAKELLAEQARQDAAKAADLALIELKLIVARQEARAARIRQDDGDVLMLLAEIL